MMTNIVMTVLFSLLMAVGQIVLSIASKEIFSQKTLAFYPTVTNKWLALGIFIYIISLALWLYILSRFEVKYAYPIASSAIFFVAIFHSILYKDFPPINYWIGLVFVTAGLVILSIGGKNNLL